MNLQELIAKGASEQEIRAAGGTDEDVAKAKKVAEALAAVETAKQAVGVSTGKKELNAKEFADQIVGAIEKGMKEKGMGKIERKYGIFGSPDDPNAEKLEKLEFASDAERKMFENCKSIGKEEARKYAKSLRVKHFFRSIMQGESSIAKGLSAGIGEDGGLLVPAEFTAEVIKLANDYGLARRECRIRQMSGTQRDIPKKHTGSTAYWVNEGGEISESSLKFKLLSLHAKKLAALIPTTNELLADVKINIVSEIAEDAALAISEKEDNALFNGTGSGANPFVGVLNSSDVNVVTMGSGKTAFSDLSFDDLVDLKNAVITAALLGAKWYAHRSVIGHVEKMKDSANQPIWTSAREGKPAYLLGYPVELHDKMPSASAASTKFLSFGNLRRSVSLGSREDLEVKFCDTSGDDFKNDMGRFRFKTRSGILVEQGEALSVLKTSNS